MVFGPTPYGLVRIESDDPAVDIIFDKDGPTMKGTEKQPVRLEPGEHRILIKRGDFRFETDIFVLKKGETITFKLEILKDRMQVVRDGQVIAAMHFPRQKEDDPLPVDSPAKKAVLVAQPVKRTLADFVDYTGQTNAMVSVVIQARVMGALTKILFKERAIVKKGDVLFEIDDRPYVGALKAAQAQLKATESQLAAAEHQKTANDAKLKLDKIVFENSKAANDKIKGTVPQVKMAEYEFYVEQSKANVKLAQANIALAKANFDLAKANLERATLNLEWTKVSSPIDGYICRYRLKLGDLATLDSTDLATVMPIDPMYVYFDMDEPTLLRIRHAVHEGKIRSGSEEMLPSHGTFTGFVGNLGFRQSQGPLPASSTFLPTHSADAPSTSDGTIRRASPTQRPKDPGTPAPSTLPTARSMKMGPPSRYAACLRTSSTGANFWFFLAWSSASACRSARNRNSCSSKTVPS